MDDVDYFFVKISLPKKLFPKKGKLIFAYRKALKIWFVRNIYKGDSSIFQQGKNARYSNCEIFNLYEANVVFGAPECLTAFGARTFLAI
jgi:hypothetical protein